MNRLEIIKSKYPGYYRKTKGWEARKKLREFNLYKNKKSNNINIYLKSINNLDINIDKLFKLL